MSNSRESRGLIAKVTHDIEKRVVAWVVYEKMRTDFQWQGDKTLTQAEPKAE